MTDSNIDKKIVDTPTHQTNPDLIIQGNLDSITSNFNHYTPRDFNTAYNVTTICNKYIEKNTHTWKSKLAEFSNTPDNRFLLIFASSMLWLPMSLGLIMAVSYGIDTIPIPNHIKNPIGVVAIITILISMVAIPIYKSEKHGLCNFNTPEFLLSHADKKTITKSEFVTIPAAVIQRIDPYYAVYTHNVQDILGHDKEILDTLDLSELRQAYDSYVDLFVFLTTNEDAISHNLYNEYRNEVRRRGTQLNSEIVAITTLIKKHKESQKELTRGQHEITQDMLDADALRTMPLIKPEDTDEVT